MIKSLKQVIEFEYNAGFISTFNFADKFITFLKVNYF